MIPITRISLLFTFFVLIYADFVQGQNIVPVHVGKSSNLTCYVEGENLQNFNWSKTIGAENIERLNRLTKKIDTNSTYVEITIQFVNVIRNDNGTYECWAETESGRIIRNVSNLLVLEKPEVQEFAVKAVIVDKLYLSWKVYDGNDPVVKYSFSYRENNSRAQWVLLDDLENAGHSNYVLDSQNKLKTGSTYQIGIEAINTINSSRLYVSNLVTPLSKDFVPKPSLDKATNHSITITWPAPEGDLQDYYRYEVTLIEKGEDVRLKAIAESNILTIESLHPKTSYLFKVKTCIINNLNICTKWSEEVEGHTTASNNSPSTFASSRTLLMNLLSLTALSLYCLMN